MIVTLADIQVARALIAGKVTRTPMLRAARLSDALGAEIFIKYENMHVTGSFKERGAFNKLSQLDTDERRRGVVAMSAGNHAQAVAYLATRLAIPATIVMPESTPFVKIDATRAFGARIELYGETLADSQVKAEAIAAEEGLVLVHPYDDPAIIAGQGTCGLEMLEDVPDLDCILVPVGGGGLISGIAIAAKALKPAIEVIGVEAELYPSAWNALHGQDLAMGGNTLAEGIAVKNIGKLTLPIMRELVSEVMLVGEGHLERAVNAYLTLQKSISEGAGAAGLAAMLARPARFAGRTVGLVLCGGNIDPRILASIMLRELARDERIVSFRIKISDRPGVLGRIATRLGELGANILEVSHRRHFLDMPAKGAWLEVTVETRDRAHADEIMGKLGLEGMECSRITPGGGGTL